MKYFFLLLCFQQVVSVLRRMDSGRLHYGNRAFTFVNINLLCVAARNRKYRGMCIEVQGGCTQVVLRERVGAVAPVGCLLW